MGYDYRLIATTKSSLKIPSNAKCVFCGFLLEDAVRLSNCIHNSCHICMMKQAQPRIYYCPIDGQKFDPKKCSRISPFIDNWLSNCKVKCRWFDGYDCCATLICLNNVRRHEEICANNPKNYSRSNHKALIKAKSIEQDETTSRINKQSFDYIKNLFSNELQNLFVDNIFDMSRLSQRNINSLAIANYLKSTISNQISNQIQKVTTNQKVTNGRMKDDGLKNKRICNNKSFDKYPKIKPRNVIKKKK